MAAGCRRRETSRTGESRQTVHGGAAQDGHACWPTLVGGARIHRHTASSSVCGSVLEGYQRERYT